MRLSPQNLLLPRGGSGAAEPVLSQQPPSLWLLKPLCCHVCFCMNLLNLRPVKLSKISALNSGAFILTSSRMFYLHPGYLGLEPVRVLGAELMEEPTL